LGILSHVVLIFKSPAHPSRQIGLIAFFRSDMNADGTANGADIALFTAALML
jgi:hypothetical protein